MSAAASIAILVIVSSVFIALLYLAFVVTRKAIGKIKAIKFNPAETLRYYTSPTLLRNHDFVASLWFDFIRDKDADTLVVAKVVAAATLVEKEIGRKFDGRPIRQGWMSSQDFADYFAFLDQYDSVDLRYRALFQQTAYFKLKSMPKYSNMKSQDNLQDPVWNKPLRELAYSIRTSLN